MEAIHIVLFGRVKRKFGLMKIMRPKSIGARPNGNQKALNTGIYFNVLPLVCHPDKTTNFSEGETGELKRFVGFKSY